MPRPSKPTLVASPLIPALLRYLRARGEDAALFATAVGLPGDSETQDEILVAPASINDVFEAASALLGEPHLALHLPANLEFRTYRFGEISARASATVREGLARLARYAPLIVPQVEATLETKDQQLEMRWSTPGHPRGLGRHAIEYALASALTYARRESAAELRALTVWFAHARPRDLLPLYRFFGTHDLTFGAADSGFALSTADGDRALGGSDGRLLATVEPLAEAELRSVPRASHFEDVVSARVEALLPDVSVEAVARALHMSARTMQRRLEDSGTRFSEVLDGVREAKAREWIEDREVPIAEVAYRLGFADLATFGRAFKRWTGMPPGTFRRG